MDFMYFTIIIITAFFISLYFYKKSKKDSNVYVIRNKNDNDYLSEKEKMQKGNIDKNKSENLTNTNDKKFDNYKFEIIYYWVTQKVLPNKNIDYNILKEIIIRTIGSLPEILENNTTFIQKEQSEFVKEVLGRAEFSSPLKYFIITKGQKLFSGLKNVFIIIGIAFFILFQFEIRKEIDKFGFFYFGTAIISCILSFVFAGLSKEFLSAILKTLKPGDYIKLIFEPDELIEKKIKINQLSSNETMFNKTTVFLSRKRMLCEDFLSQSSQMLNTISNKLCLYIVIDYLKINYSKEAYREYLLEKEIDALEFICGFNPNAVSANFELALLYFESKRFDDFYKMLLKYRTVNGYDWMIESYIKSYEFYKMNCEK